MNLESIEEGVDILGFAILELLQNLDLVNGDINGIIFGTSVGVIICSIDVDNLEGNNTVVHLIVAI